MRRIPITRHLDPQHAEELPLFQGGYEAVTVEFTTHLTGINSALAIGLTIYDPYTREPIAIHAFPYHGTVTEPEAAAEWITRTLVAIRALLAPF